MCLKLFQDDLFGASAAIVGNNCRHGYDGGTQHDGAGSVTRMSTLTVTQRNGRITQSSKNSTVITAIVESNINGDDDFAKLCDADREIDKLSDITRDADSNKNNIKKDRLSDIKEESMRNHSDERS